MKLENENRLYYGNFKGCISSVAEKRYNFYLEFNKIQDLEKFFLISEDKKSEFLIGYEKAVCDPKGNILEFIDFRSCKKETFIYDINDNEIERKEFSNEILCSQSLFYYDNRNNQVKEIQLDNEGRKNKIILSEYNSEDQILKKYYYNSSEELTDEYTFLYNKNGHLIETEHDSNLHCLSDRNHMNLFDNKKESYDYDSIGHKIKQSIFINHLRYATINFKFNNEGKMIEEDEISTNIMDSLYYQNIVPKRDRITKTQYSYDQIGNLEKKIENKKEMLDGVCKKDESEFSYYKSNDFGDTIEVAIHGFSLISNENKIFNENDYITINSIEYLYDSSKNPIREINYENNCLTSIIIREIDYFELLE